MCRITSFYIKLLCNQNFMCGSSCRVIFLRVLFFVSRKFYCHANFTQSITQSTMPLGRMDLKGLFYVMFLICIEMKFINMHYIYICTQLTWANSKIIIIFRGRGHFMSLLYILPFCNSSDLSLSRRHIRTQHLLLLLTFDISNTDISKTMDRSNSFVSPNHFFLKYFPLDISNTCMY